MALFAGIEAGGTKFVCGVGPGDQTLSARLVMPTLDPETTLGRVARFLADHADVAAVGVASFGPVDLEPSSPGYGHITALTPKVGWLGVDILGAVQAACPGRPVGLDTDVNAAAIAEHRWGAARRSSCCVYLTVGTGIGGGLVIDGRPVHGARHPEIGHMRIPHDPKLDPFPGICPYHGDCLEGLASGPAMARRWSVPPTDLPPDHPGWELEAGYLAAGIANLIMTVSPQTVVLGGGVGSVGFLLERVRSETTRLIAGYVEGTEIVAPGLGADAGVLGAIALAEDQPGRLMGPPRA